MDMITFWGRMHPLVVHLPVGFLLLAGVFYFLGKKEKFSALHKALPTTFFLSALSATVVALFGWRLAADGNYGENTLFWHKWMGIDVAVLSATAFVWSVQKKNTPIWLILTSIMLLGAAGHLGGSLTHGEDYLIQPLMGEVILEKQRSGSCTQRVIGRGNWRRSCKALSASWYLGSGIYHESSLPSRLWGKC